VVSVVVVVVVAAVLFVVPLKEPQDASAKATANDSITFFMFFLFFI
jgi:hypothetical protein